ncbi:MAG: hypothetical protein V7K25_23220 [Nostoc sp.]|uniref:hypothetical protein n=1 Tax=Nostoc sp. TaxID=1180 RepID=UPI002FF8D60C
MSTQTNTSIPQNIVPALNQLQDEVTKVEQALLELRRKKQEFLQYQLSSSLENLSVQADKVNTLAISLETEILKFQETAVELDNIYQTIHSSPSLSKLGNEILNLPNAKITNIWKINRLDFSVPTIVKQESQFILTVKTININQQTVCQPNLGQTITLSPSKNKVNHSLKGIDS